jgi:ribosomal protein S4
MSVEDIDIFEKEENVFDIDNIDEIKTEFKLDTKTIKKRQHKANKYEDDRRVKRLTRPFLRQLKEEHLAKKLNEIKPLKEVLEDE